MAPPLAARPRRINTLDPIIFLLFFGNYKFDDYKLLETLVFQNPTEEGLKLLTVSGEQGNQIIRISRHRGEGVDDPGATFYFFV